MDKQRYSIVDSTGKTVIVKKDDNRYIGIDELAQHIAMDVIHPQQATAELHPQQATRELHPQTIKTVLLWHGVITVKQKELSVLILYWLIGRVTRVTTGRRICGRLKEQR